jgi:hypothetical protein
MKAQTLKVVYEKTSTRLRQRNFRQFMQIFRITAEIGTNNSQQKRFSIENGLFNQLFEIQNTSVFLSAD